MAINGDKKRAAVLREAVRSVARDKAKAKKRRDGDHMYTPNGIRLRFPGCPTGASMPRHRRNDPKPPFEERLREQLRECIERRGMTFAQVARLFGVSIQKVSSAVQSKDAKASGMKSRRKPRLVSVETGADEKPRCGHSCDVAGPDSESSTASPVPDAVEPSAPVNR
jgi:hypothetical protein